MDQWRTAVNAMSAAQGKLHAPVVGKLVTGENAKFLEDLMDTVDEAKEFLEVIAATRRAVVDLNKEAAKLDNVVAADALMNLAKFLSVACDTYEEARAKA